MKKLQFGEYKNIIGTTVKRMRIERNISQQELASKMQLLNVNIDQQMISKIEQNKRLVTDYELLCFCHIFHIEVHDIFEDFYASNIVK